MRILRWTAIIVLIAAIFILLLLLIFWWCLRCQPAYYRNLEVINVERAKENSLAMTRKIAEARNNLRRPEAHDWVFEFSEYELNHWVEIERKEKYPGMFRRITDPRGTIREDKITCGTTVDIPNRGFEYDGVLSVDFFPYMKEPNVFAFKIFKFRAGIVSLPQSVTIKQITELAEDHALPVSWIQEDGYHVLVVDFTRGDLSLQFENRDVTVKKIELGHGKITISGNIAAKKKKE